MGDQRRPKREPPRLLWMRLLAENSQRQFGGSHPTLYWTHAIISLDEGMKRLMLAFTDPPNYANQRIHGTSCYLGGNRIRTFLKGTNCVRCGVKGTHFKIQRINGYEDYHLNLYATYKSGKEVLMTSDHIRPLSKGGSNGLSNRQPMCLPCNGKKGNKWHPQK